MITRRGFIKHVTAAMALGAAAQVRGEETAPARLTAGAAERVTLGRTGLRVSVLGLGTGTNGVGGASNQTRAGQAEFTRLVRHAIDRGINYLDCADQYGSHSFVRQALREAPAVQRDDLFILTKTHAQTAEQARADVDRYRQELGVDVINCVLLHCMTDRGWPAQSRGAMDGLAEAKQRGVVRSVGVSCHGWAPLEACRNVDWIDVQLARINPYGAAMDGKPEQVAPELKAMHDAGRGVLGMKIFCGGRPMSSASREKSLKYVLGLGSVDAFTIGFESIEQFDDTYDMIGRLRSRAA